MSVTQEIKSRLDIVDIVSEHVQLRRSGKNYAGFCPFHSNTRSPAFYVFPETQTWHCFGACAEGGDLFNFVMKKEGWEFKETLEYLAQRAGVQLEEQTPAARQRQAAVAKLTDLLTAAADYFHQLLLHAPQAEHARRYVAARRLSAETQHAFRLGYALDSWDACRTHFNAQGYDDEELLQAGLLTENPEKQTRYDRFRNRLMIPIRDVDGRVVGFGARTLEKDGIPKYLNSPQTELFDKSRLLFGLDGAKRHIREGRQAVIVEGYMDVMQGWQAGFRNIVAQMGTALTEQQLQLLKRYTKRFILALDADAAGAKATMRSLEVARETLDREYEIRFDARGLVQHEGRLKADIRIVTLPEGQDPDSIIRHNHSQWPQLLAAAKPVVEYVIGVATRDLDLSDAKAKSAVAQQIIPLITDITDPVEREHYRQMLARALRIDERTLRLVRVVEKERSAQPYRPTTPITVQKRSNGAPAHRLAEKAPAVALREDNFLCLCLLHPHLIAQVNQRLIAQREPPVSAKDFRAVEDRALVNVLYEQLEQSTVVAVDELCDSLDTVLAERARALLALSPQSDVDLEQQPDKLAMSVLDWRLGRLNGQVAQLQQLFREAEGRADPEDELVEMRQQIQDLTVLVLRINRAKKAFSAAERRRAE